MTMTTITFSKDLDTFHVVNESRSKYVPRSQFYAAFTDQDLIDVAGQALESPGEVIAVPSTSNAKGL